MIESQNGSLQIKLYIWQEMMWNFYLPFTMKDTKLTSKFA